MKCLLILVVLVAMVVCPAMALKTDFQSYTAEFGPTTQLDWTFGADWNVRPPNTYGHVVMYDQRIFVADTGLVNVNPHVSSYIAWTNPQSSSGHAQITLLDATGTTTLLILTPAPPLTPGRYELVMAGGTATLYHDDAAIASGAITQNPGFFSIALFDGDMYMDDIILGDASDKSIVGALPQNFFILYDSASPASTGLYKSNSPSAPTLINSNYFGVSYGRPNNPATNLLIRDPTGTLVKSYPVNNQSCECVIPIADLYVGGAITNGKWTVSLEDTPTTSQDFFVFADGATVAWNSATYAQQDTASITYAITAGRWNPASYTYSLKIIDVYGNIINTQSITSQTGTLSYTWQDSDALGVYYAEVFQTSIADPTSSVLLNYDATTLTGTFSFSGYVLDAESAAPLAGAGVNFTQLGTPRVSTSAADGSYSASGFVTGGSVIVNVTKSGYVQYYNTITPTRSRNIALNLSILSTNPTKVGATLGSIFRDTTYGGLIPGVAATATNGSTVITGTTNNAGYVPFYNLVNGTCYRISGSKTGYAMPSSNPTGSLKCAGGLL